MFTDIVWRFLILEMFVMGASCCTCVYEHPQSHFCKSELVLKVEIQEEIESPKGNAFRVEIIKVFKGDVQELKLIQNRYVILKMPRNCVVDMNTENNYVIFGQYKNGHIYTEMCNGNMPWSMTTPFYRNGLAKYYKNNCDCAPDISQHTRYESRECQWRFSFMKRRGKKCKWVKSSSYQNCKHKYFPRSRFSYRSDRILLRQSSVVQPIQKVRASLSGSEQSEIMIMNP